jgi:DNA-3-methyladenine glycosylase I
MTDLIRCEWAGTDPLYVAYHDEEWGVPVHDDRRLFEMLCLEGAQAGLAWITILRKREHYRVVFDNFDAATIASYGDDKIAALLADPGIVRNRLKVNAFIQNARAFLAVQTDVWQLRRLRLAIRWRRTYRQPTAHAARDPGADA